MSHKGSPSQTFQQLHKRVQNKLVNEIQRGKKGSNEGRSKNNTWMVSFLRDGSVHARSENAPASGRIAAFPGGFAQTSSNEFGLKPCTPPMRAAKSQAWTSTTNKE
eukprot:3865231-Amphidinium_carterae.1